jgi:hypothetical protein
MTDIHDFLDRLDAARDTFSDPADLVSSPGALDRSGLEQLPLFQRRAERAGLDLPDLEAALRPRCEQARDIILGRIVAQGDGADVPHELLTLALGAASTFFLAGVLWEQERHLPDIGGAPC